MQEGSDDEIKPPQAATAAEAARSDAEHTNVSTLWEDEVDSRTLAMGLRSPRVGVGNRPLEQVMDSA